MYFFLLFHTVAKKYVGRTTNETRKYFKFLFFFPSSPPFFRHWKKQQFYQNECYHFDVDRIVYL